jgi:CBS domain-containing protein
MSLQRFTRKQVATIATDASARQAAELMRERHVGAIIVTEGGRPVGMVTDRDLALRVVAANRDPNVPVAEVVSRKLLTLAVADTIDQALFTMRREGVRRVPIVDREGSIVGMVTLDDLLVLLAGELSSTASAIIDNRGP